MEEEQGGREGEGDAKWVGHYSSDHKILLVGEGDFSFSLSLAHSFGSASNIVASSLDSYDDVNKKYKQAKSNLDELQKLGACLLHGVDATKMKFHSDLKMRQFNRVIFNFPHSGFHGKEDNLEVIEKHKDLVLRFFKNASPMLRANGEIHVNHKTTTPFDKWNIGKLAMESSLTLIECTDFKKEDYPGYNNKRGDGNRCDKPFPLGKCSTFKFIRIARAMGKAKRRKQKCLRQQISHLLFQGIQDNNVRQLPPTTNSVDPNCYPQPSYHDVSKFNETVASLYGLSIGYTPSTVWNLLNNVAPRSDAPCDGYSAHSTRMIPGSQRLLQPLQPMEPLKSFQPWPTSTNVRYSQTDHVRTIDNVHLPLGTRNEGYQVFSRNSNYLQETRGGTSQNSSYSYDRLMPEFQSRISEMHWRALNGANHVHSEHPLMEDRRRMFVGPDKTL